MKLTNKSFVAKEGDKKNVSLRRRSGAYLARVQWVCRINGFFKTPLIINTYPPFLSNFDRFRKLTRSISRSDSTAIQNM